MESDDGTAPVALAPSAVPNERFRVMPRALTVAEIEELVASYGDAAGRLARAGLDGVEVVASHGYLPAQFLSAGTNRRDDAYGGDEERRLRFVREVLVAARAAVGPSKVVGMRISLDERDPTGLEADAASAAVVALAGAGLLDYVSVTTGTSATLGGSDHIVPEMSVANGYMAGAAGGLKAAVAIPVIVAGRLNQPQDAERVLAAGQADACVMTRALIADPEMPNLAAEGRTDDIRACIACNQACIGHFHAGYPISCVQHPETGRERQYGTRTRADRVKDVLVVGGGPAGLKAAAVAAERGHRVTLMEASRVLGGQLMLAQNLPGRAEIGGIVENLAGEARRAGVQLLMGSSVDAQVVADRMPDAVVVATGATPRVPPLELVDSPVVMTAWDVLRGADVPPGRVVVADWRCDWIGLGIANLLAQRGHPVTLGVSGYHPGQRIQQYVRDAMLAEATALGVSIVPLVRPYGADADSVYLQHVLTEEAVVVEDAAALVLAQGHDSVAGLANELDREEFELHVVGDSLAPRTVEEAVLDGLVAASAL
ncbi:MAG TPA: FAD-dependent oxidoreductase, partial [Thermomicrobiaceae bacterium]|nr:FAD-dependent oxidoreductase [Thermomicrobiaceae bacterium]